MTRKRERPTSTAPSAASAAMPSPDPLATPASASQGADFLALLSAPRVKPSWPPEPTFVATCVDARHPTLPGRVEVSWADGSGEVSQRWWVPTLQGLAVRTGDRLLLSRAGGLPEPIVVGVVDGFAQRPAPGPDSGPTLEIQPDEVLTIVARSGQPLVQIRHGADGPRVQLLSPDTQIELSGRLSISAAELTLKAQHGNVQIEASEQVVVTGETVQLN